MKPHFVSRELMPDVSGMAFPMEIIGAGGAMLYDAIRQDAGVVGSKALLKAIVEAYPDGPDAVPDWLLPGLAREPARLSEAELQVDVFDIADLWENFERMPGTPAMAWRDVTRAAYPGLTGPDGFAGAALELYREGMADLERIGLAGRTLSCPVGLEGVVSAEATVTPEGKAFFVMEYEDGTYSNMRWIGLDGDDVTEVDREDALRFPVADEARAISVANEMSACAAGASVGSIILNLVGRNMAEYASELARSGKKGG